MTAPSAGRLHAQGTDKATQQTALNEEDLLLCLVRLGGSTLTGDLVTYTTPAGVFLPLGELSRLLELGITVDPASGKASGSVARPSQPFMLDLGAATLTVSGKHYPCDTALAVAMPDDIYVESKQLGGWLGLGINANRFDAAIDIRPFEPLPIQERMARNQRGSNSWGYGSYNDPGYAQQETPYRVLAGPSIDLSLSASVSGDPEHRIGLGDSRFYTRATGDFLWMSGRVDLSGQFASRGNSSPGVNNGSVLLERANHSGGLLGILDARRVSVGDIPYSSLPLIGSTAGPGIMISSYQLQQSSFFDKLTLSGFLAKGWDVELYNNGSLLDYRPSNPQESYAFVDIPLVYDLNELRLVFYGPQGERRTETHLYFVGRNMIEPGTWSYQATATDASRNLLLGPATGNTAPLMTWKSTFGMSKWLTASNYLASALIGNERQSFAGGGLSGYLKMMQFDLQAAENVATGKMARQVGVQTRLNPVTLSFLIQEFDSGWQPATGTISYLRRWETRMDGIHPFPFLINSRIALDFLKTEYDALRSSNTMQLTSFNRTGGGINHTHTLAFEQTHGGLGSGDVLSGTSYANLMDRNFSLRADLGYRLMPNRAISNVGISRESRLSHEWLLTNSIGYSPLSHTLTASIGINRTAGPFALGVTGNYTGRETWNVGIQLSTNLSREPQSGEWRTNGSLNSQLAGVSALAFLDLNHNKQKDPEEQELQDVGFIVNQQRMPAVSNSNGVAFFQGLAPYVPTDISISASTLKELLWIPAEKGVRVVPRPGYPVQALVPVWITGEVSGRAYRRKEGVESLAPGIAIEALDKTGKVIARTRSEYDGVYILGALPPGMCTVRVSPDQAGKLGTTAPVRQVTIPSDGAYIDNIDLVLDNDPTQAKG
ncbi:MAG: carboxypeptidase regulatory-like domain-containing protein [Chlorobiaceae bacterium]|nr:carboxypeptidase regulatory-like domain-containing protein [Chlorobiaceae bacterium]